MLILWMIFVGCELPDPSTFAAGSGNLYEGGTQSTHTEDTGSIEDSDSEDSAIEDTGTEDSADTAMEDTSQ